MTGALADLKQWVMDTGEPELEAEFRKLYVLVCQRQCEEYEACKRAASDNGDFESWLHGQTNY